MPPKVKFTKEQIIECAFSMVKENGIQILTARSLAEKLGTSTAPLFTAFRNIDEIKAHVRDKAENLYKDYIYEGLKEKIPFKGTGLQYIRFAKDEPQLFRFLFMQENGKSETTHFLPSSDKNSPAVLSTVMNCYGISEEKAMKLYNHLSVYCYGLAVLFAMGSCVFTMDDVSRMLTEMFMALTKEK